MITIKTVSIFILKPPIGLLLCSFSFHKNSSFILCRNAMVCLIFIKDLLIKTPIVYYNIEENILTPQSSKIIILRIGC